MRCDGTPGTADELRAVVTWVQSLRRLTFSGAVSSPQKKGTHIAAPPTISIILNERLALPRPLTFRAPSHSPTRTGWGETPLQPTISHTANNRFASLNLRLLAPLPPSTSSNRRTISLRLGDSSWLLEAKERGKGKCSMEKYFASG